ncbi:hypothetical protein N3K63_01140 [Microbacterium sp. W1N]|uniref:hypothetical protein n=1 Tax=Microbacterium festucae TaxID=2977531 RepID=UPI0021BF2AE6|nr:hypothetical protein [Microbacterium festucae]MCT9818883.1 hypothetical protein [Microbacterium festucae]
MADAVWINYATLRRTSDRLGRIIEELEDARGLADELRAAIGSPYGHGALRDRAGDFESRWDNRRSDLVRDITSIHEHVEGVLDGFADWDAETGAQMDVDASGLSDATRPTPV